MRLIKKQLDNRGHGLGLRLGVKEAGCTGYAYTLDFVDELDDGDAVHEQYGVKVIVSEKDVPYLNVDSRKYHGLFHAIIVSRLAIFLFALAMTSRIT